MSWMWMNLSLAIVFVGAFAGIPLFMVLRNPSWSSRPTDAAASMTARPHAGAAAEPVFLVPGALASAA
jgi:hypothetical protein